MNRSARSSALVGYAIFFIVFLYLPVLLLPVFSFNDSIFAAFPLKGFTVKWYEEMVENAALMEALGNSLKVGAAVAVVSTILGLLAAKALTRYYMPGRGPVTGLILLPLVIPSIVLGLGLLILVIQFLGIQPSLITIAAGHVLLAVPFSTLVMISRLEGFDKNLEEASIDLGENAWQTFWRITFPLALPGIMASLLLCFTASFDEFLLAFFLAGNEATLPLFIWGQLRYPNKLPSVMALGSCILAASFLIVAFSERLRRRGVRPTVAGAVE